VSPQGGAFERLRVRSRGGGASCCPLDCEYASLRYSLHRLTTLKGIKLNLERRKVCLIFVTDGNVAVIQNLNPMHNSTDTQRKKAQMASALFNDVQLLGSAITCTAGFDALSCDDQMRLEDLIGGENV
jgi:hypothetical protein